ncbi:MAG: S1C family serine protease [Actinomycetota bacterium]|nr:S1C family serine protease [Actinomycetota bacterium]
MSDSYWQTEVTWGGPAPGADDEHGVAAGRPGATAGPEWVIPPPAAGRDEWGWAPPNPSGGGGLPPRPILVALVTAIVVTLLVGFGAGLVVRADRGSQPPDASPTPSAPSTPPSTAATPGGGGIAVADLDITAIAAKVDPSVVDIASTLGYQNGAAAGTGMVLTSSGEVLTNNHVIDGATTLSAQVNGEGRTYDVKVLGSDSTHDVALIQLVGASGLTAVSIGDPSRVAVGDQVVALGNALGRGGTPAVESGFVTGIDQSITAGDPATGTAEELTGLIQVDAALKPGDSGGPLVDMTGRVIGLDTAASVATRYRPSSNAGFAIRIDDALSVVDQIRSGTGTATVQIGQPAFLGVQVQFVGGSQGSGGYVDPGGPGARITGVVPDGPAEAAGLAVGDVIVAIDGKPVNSPTSLTGLLRVHRPGDRASVTWVDDSGQQHTANVRLGTGPAS